MAFTQIAGDTHRSLIVLDDVTDNAQELREAALLWLPSRAGYDPLA